MIETDKNSNIAFAKDGYKETKLGCIPDNWSTPTIDEIFEFLRTTSFSRDQLNYEDVNDTYYIHYGDIHATYKTPILDFKESQKVPKLNRDVILPTSIQYLQDGDVIIADASEDYEGVGAAIELQNLDEKKVISGLHTFALRDKEGLTVEGFRTYIFKNQIVKKALKTIATGSKVFGISKGNVRKFKIVLPTLREQQKIASILNTWDKAIEAQEKIIKEKQSLKKGLMQQLLTGKKRFAGFTEEWKNVRLEELAKITMGQSPDSNSYNDRDDGLWLIQGNADIKNRKSSPRIWTNQPTKTCEVGDVLMTVRAPVGSIAKSEHKACIGRGVCSIKPMETNDFVYYKLLNFEKKWSKYEQGSTFSAVSSSDIKNLKISIPNSIQEQHEVSKVLTSMDNDIEKTIIQLKSLKTQKQGLIQQLLTGEKRVKV